MISFDWKLFLKVCGIFFLSVLAIVLVQKHINNQVSLKIQTFHELKAKELAEYKLKCETEKIDQTTELKKQIVDLETELEKSKILIEKIQKQGKVTEQIKKDVKGFMKEFDTLIGTRGKADEK